MACSVSIKNDCLLFNRLGQKGVVNYLNISSNRSFCLKSKKLEIIWLYT